MESSLWLFVWRSASGRRGIREALCFPREAGLIAAGLRGTSGMEGGPPRDRNRDVGSARPALGQWE